MTRHALGLVVALVVVAFAGQAWAWTPFGTDERITRLEDVGLTTPGGDALFIGYKISTVYFIGGVYVSNDGYVLGLRATPKYYVDMPPPDMLAEFQRKGMLPNPLPPYRMEFGDYLKGFSLWLVVLPIAAAYLYVLFIIRGGGRRRRLRRL